MLAMEGRWVQQMKPLIINSVLLLAANVFLAAAIARNSRIRAELRKIINMAGMRNDGAGLAFEDRKNNGVISRLNLFRRFELQYIVKSNIRHYIPFMNVYTLLFIVAAIFVAVYRPVSRLLEFFPSAAAISGMISAVPLFALDILSRYNSETIRKKMSDYISVLNRWCSVKEDIMYAFEKSLGSGVGEPLETFVRDMLIQVNSGMDASEALDILQLTVGNPHFDDFILNIKQNLKHRGDIVKLLSNLESQFYKIDEEYERRKISTYKDRMLIYFIMLGVLVTAYFFMRLSPQVSGFYLRTVTGKLLLTVFSIMYMLGFYLAAGITRFRI
jgi:Flp pilus assembly protein TadB